MVLLYRETIYLLRWSILTLVTLAQGLDSYCTFPVEWRDRWHQNGIGDVMVSESEISRKGRCIESRHEYYLLENRDIGCFTCLEIKPRHQNILQYKEKFSLPVACPFHDAYHFSYNNNSGGYCTEPASYAKPCASSAQIRLRFQHCSNAAYTHERAVDLECLGLWKEGNENYMIGQLTGDGLRTKDTRYRCFMYNTFGTLIYMAMSWDASCFGIISPTNGPITLEFTQDVFGWPVPSCKFPPWLAVRSWKDLSGRHVFQSSSEQTIITESFKQDVTSSAEEQKAYRCHRVLQQNTTENQFTIVSFTSYGCSTKYQCLKFLKRKDGVIEVHEGPYMNYETDPCLASQMFSSNTKLLIPADVQARHCPLPGRYRIHTGSSVCAGHIRIGCNGSSVLDILSSCSSKPGLQLECLKSWREDKRRYLVARVLGDTTGRTNCFSFRKKDRSWYFAVDNDCNKGAPFILRDFVTYVLDTEALPCEPVRKYPEVRSDNQSARDRPAEGGTVYGGSYKHVDPAAGSGGAARLHASLPLVALVMSSLAFHSARWLSDFHITRGCR